MLDNNQRAGGVMCLNMTRITPTTWLFSNNAMSQQRFSNVNNFLLLFKKKSISSYIACRRTSAKQVSSLTRRTNFLRLEINKACQKRKVQTPPS